MSDPQVGAEGVVMRPARRGDLAAIESIASRTWNGRDYLIDVVDAWIDDPTGEFVVAEVDGKVAGTVKVSRLGQARWWLEACRVDPDARERGLGRELMRFAVVRAGELQTSEGGTGVMGAVVDESNVPSLRILTSIGFVELVRFTRCVAACESTSGVSDFHVLDAVDVDRAVEFVDHSELVAVAAGTQSHRPVGVTLDRQSVSALIDARRLYGWSGVRHEPQRLDGLLAVGDISTGARSLSITYLDAPGELVSIASGTRSLGAALGATTVEHLLQADPARVASMLRARWRRPAGLNLSVMVAREIGAEQAV